MTDTPLNLTLTFQDIDSARPVSVTDVLVGQGKPAFTIGSHEKSHLRIADPEIPPAYAAITLRDGDYWIAPRFPQYTVLIDNIPLKRPFRLTEGNIVGLGGYTLRVSLQPVPELTASASEPSSALSRDYLPRSSAIESSRFDAGQVFFPKQHAPQRSSRSVLVVGLLVVALLVFGGYTLYSRVIQPSSEAVTVTTNPFAFEDDNVTVLMFDASWCGARCINQKGILKEVAGQFRGSVYINYADVDSPGNAFLLNRFRVDDLPFVVVFDDTGDPVAAYSGPVDSATLRQAVSAALQLSRGTNLFARNS